MEYLFGGVMLAGLVYLVLMIVGLGDSLDLDIEGFFGFESADADGIGCSAVAAFMAGFGALGLTGTLMGWNPIGTLLTAILIGLVIARVSMSALRFVYRQQSSPITFSAHDLIGKAGHATIDSAPGTTGEVLVEAQERHKYPVKEIDGAALKRGDRVTVVDVEGRYLRVRKQS